jgi:LPXTG-motif cell wall-anchored protein
MDSTTLILAGIAIVFAALWMMRRRSRLKSDRFE